VIIRIEASGGSFLGAGKYYLHDKLSSERAGAARSGEGVSVLGQSDARVWFTDTRNTLNSDPERALEEMWRTAQDQAYLKMQAGVKRGGRVCEDPVKTISLSWHKDDTPTPEHIVASADAFLKHMGWDNHQAVYVGHSDTEHRHIHIILNRVDHETGRTLDDYRERMRAQSWALTYEKAHDNVRCEERELRAAKREQRAPELNDGIGPVHATQETPTPQPTRTPANDPLPHNVVMLARPQEQAFKADEQAREQRDRQEHAHLMAEQRAEREAFFADGGKLFKATRHAVYGEVRKEYAPEWRQFYKDSEAAEKSAEAWSANSVSRAFYFARSGRWEEARAAFSDRDSVRDAVSAELAERKADLKERQTDDLRERQRDACDALREVREVQYQELLQRQRDERAAVRPRQTLQGVGLGREAAPADVVAKTLETGSANQNREARSPEPMTADIRQHAPAPEISPQSTITHRQQPGIDASAEKMPEPAARNDDIADRVAEPVLVPLPEAPEPTRQVADLAAGCIGAVASYLADQLGEMFAPTTPEVREADVKAAAKREAEQPAPEPQANPYAKIIDAAVRAIEAERAQKDDAYWKERDRGKDWERDR
jgi:hypothetical protein